MRNGCLLHRLLMVSVELLFLLTFSWRASGQAPESNKPLAAAIVAGVINYTRWPQLGESLRICFVGESANMEEIRQLSTITRKMVGYPSTFQILSQEKKMTQECDLVYVGQLSEGETKALLNAVDNTAILTIGEGKEFCSLGGMFCLEAQPRAGSVGFAANLDAISRGKLRVNPQVLRLSSRINQAFP
jgi:hypothetical protein